MTPAQRQRREQMDEVRHMLGLAFPGRKFSKVASQQWVKDQARMRCVSRSYVARSIAAAFTAWAQSDLPGVQSMAIDAIRRAENQTPEPPEPDA